MSCQARIIYYLYLLIVNNAMSQRKNIIRRIISNIDRILNTSGARMFNIPMIELTVFAVCCLLIKVLSFGSIQTADSLSPSVLSQCSSQESWRWIVISDYNWNSSWPTSQSTSNCSSVWMSFKNDQNKIMMCRFVFQLWLEWTSILSPNIQHPTISCVCCMAEWRSAQFYWIIWCCVV